MANKLELVLQDALSKAVGLPDQRYTLVINYRGFQMRSLSVVSYRHCENYLDSIFDAIIVDAVFSIKDYSGIMMSGHEDITAILESNGYDGGCAKRSKYRAILLNSDDQRTEGNSDLANSLDVADSQSFATASFQLIDTAAYDIRMRQVGGIFKNTTAANVLKYILSKNMLKGQYSNQENITSINFDNNVYPKVYDTIVIPEGTKLVSVGDYLHNRYGVFTAGFGIYLKSRKWYVYSPYNVVKSKQSVEKIIFINAPVNKYGGSERNYFVDNKTITIIGTGETKMLKTADDAALNEGTGTRFADASQLMEFGALDPTDQKPKMHPKDYMTEYKGVKYNNPFNNTQMVEGRFSSNAAVQSSKMASLAGTIVNSVWENGTMDVFTPGMPVEFIYSKDGNVLKHPGTLLKAELVSQVPANGMVEPRHKNMVALSIFLKPH